MTGRNDSEVPGQRGLYDPRMEHDSCGVGFVAHIKGERSHQIVRDAETVLKNMDHRGACGCEANTGDGAGMLTALPHEFLRKVAKDELKADLPEPGRFAAGVVFFPKLAAERVPCKRAVERIIAEQGQRLVGWRKVFTCPNHANIGETARAGEPWIEQLFVAAADGVGADEFERQLYLIRKRASHEIRGNPDLRQAKAFYICSLSTRVIVYKGMLTSHQLTVYYRDLCDPDYVTHLAMVHSRFSTNTFPSWDRAQPNRFMSHNGEINTLRGNMNWMQAREGLLQSEVFGPELARLFPVVEPDCSDSGTFDNVLEFFLQTGRTLQEAVMMMVPEAWQHHEAMPEAKRAFYEYHSCLMEPWDGPASIVFTDGKYIGAVLDRNGLRPSRYCLTHDDRVIMASEVGVLPILPKLIKEKGRLQPGRMFLVDFEQGRLVPDEELKSTWAAQRPYAAWLRERRIDLEKLPPADDVPGYEPETLLVRMQAHGYTQETMQFMLLPMVRDGRDPVGSMGNDAALACLSDQPRMLYDYFRQLFAQVTNPPIDSIREEIVMSMECYIGPERNLLETTAEHANRLRIGHPILTNAELASIKQMSAPGWATREIDVTYPREQGVRGMTAALDRVCAEAEAAVDRGCTLVVLSDRAMDDRHVPLPMLMACGAVHHHLIRQVKRTRIGLVLETGEAREVHHHCLLVGYGADAINPYLALEALWEARRDGRLDGGLSQFSRPEGNGAPSPDDSGGLSQFSRPEGNDAPSPNASAAKMGLSPSPSPAPAPAPAPAFPDDDAVVAAYRKAVSKGMLKVMGKMGISTLQSYKGAQIFEAVGLDDEVVERCFEGTGSRVRGVGFNVLAQEALERHARGYPLRESDHQTMLPNPGEFHWRAEGERHSWQPEAIADLQAAARTDSRERYRRFAERVNADAAARCQLKALLSFKPGAMADPIPLEEVEPASEIVKRFCTGAMSFGSISEEAHTSLAEAMNAVGGKSNTGEGGEDPARLVPLPDGRPNPRRSAIKQVASGRFGVTIDYLTQADELQIKVAQGAKPGEGGELPGHKVDRNIARIRHSTPGVGLISPPPHHDIYSIEDLKQLIHDLKNANPAARISVKLVSEMGVGTIAAGVAKAHADHIVIAGDGGGTGASPLTSIKHAGLPWELGLAETHQTLVLNDLRSRVALQTDGGLKTGRDVVLAALLGAEEFGFATAPLITLGCMMMRKCHLNTCPVGVATQDPYLRKKFQGKPEHVIRYLFMVAEEARELMARLGFGAVEEMIGRVDVLERNPDVRHWKIDGLDLTLIITPARRKHERVSVFCTQKQDHQLEAALDNKLIALARGSIQRGAKSRVWLPIVNTNRAVGTMLSHEIAKHRGEQMLPDGTIHIKLTGSAGQSFGAFLAQGVTLELEGDANDYVGKGLSGGRVVVYPPKDSTFTAEENIIVGNVVLYGAVRGQAFFPEHVLPGQAFFRGRAAERFAVRNSGAQTVIEGVGDHGCEYMTGGRVVILGPTGRNFAAGMSGGIAYLWDPNGEFPANCNMDMVELQQLEDTAEIDHLRSLITQHQEATGSTLAASLLGRWTDAVPEFVKVMPLDYKRALAEAPASAAEPKEPELATVDA